MEEEPKEKFIKALTAKEIKKLVRPEFEANPEKFYPTATLTRIGYSRARCSCGNYYWRRTEKRDTCGDSNCVGKYTFIGKGCGIGLKGKKLTYGQAWRGFQRSLTSTRIPCKTIQRYPVVARWRNDVDYVAAGIFCFQPYCVTGQLDPPANPLICPQFCVRFNDLDNIGLTGRHYSGFVMLGIQVFNYPKDFKFFKEECVEFNFRWLTEELGIDPDEITFVEDVWAGGGNLGPSIEYFIHGLEIGNMVFMQYKYFPNGDYKELDIKIIDTGIGLERIPWLINGSPTSYFEIFPKSLAFVSEKLAVPLSSEVWEKLGPYSCLLNVDEVDDLAKVWALISQKIGMPMVEVQKAIEPVRELFIVLDHTRTAMVIIYDGSLPSNVGGGSNCRNILRRVFALLKKNDWWDKLGGVDGLMHLLKLQGEDLAQLYGPLGEYSSFQTIIRSQVQRWKNTDTVQKQKLQKMLKKKPNLDIDDWILAMQTWGLPADAIAQLSKQTIPGNLYYEIARRQEICVKAADLILYDTALLPQTQNLYYKDHRQLEFQSKIVAALDNKTDEKLGKNVIVLASSAFYPTSGGQQNDVGTLTIAGQTLNVVNVEKIGRTFLHFLQKEPKVTEAGTLVSGRIDGVRRQTLRSFHTGTHIVFAACRRILGPHVWQSGAKKNMNGAHLDITHFSSLTKEQELAIENEANRIVLSCKKINKYFMDKAEAELKHGFRLYQGGVIPGNSLRIVDIEDTDIEACCGTHCDNTSEVGWIKLLKTGRISDGVLRLSYVASERVIEHLNQSASIINALNKLWGINQTEIVDTADRIFKGYKKYEAEAMEQKRQIMHLQQKYLCEGPLDKLFIRSYEKDPTIYHSEGAKLIKPLFDKGKSVVFIGETFLFALLADKAHIDVEGLKKVLSEDNEPKALDKMVIQQRLAAASEGKKKDKKAQSNVYENSLKLFFTGAIKIKKLEKVLNDAGFATLS